VTDAMRGLGPKKANVGKRRGLPVERFHRQTHVLITEQRIKNEIPGSKVERVSSGDPFML
jgi:hypothetical protein